MKCIAGRHWWRGAISGLVLIVCAAPALAQTREKTREEFNQRAQAEQDAYMRDWNAQQEALRREAEVANQRSQAEQEAYRVQWEAEQAALRAAASSPAPEDTQHADSVAAPASEMSAVDEPVATRSEASFSERSDSEDVSFLLVIAFVVAALLVYMVPTIIAFVRRHHYKWPILAFNLGAAWTGLGWIGTLVWSLWPHDKSLLDPVLNDATGIDRKS